VGAGAWAAAPRRHEVAALWCSRDAVTQYAATARLYAGATLTAAVEPHEVPDAR
jgi:hypothetical protein